MSINYMVHKVDQYFQKFSTSFTELKDRSEKSFQEVQRRISTLEKRPVCDAAYIERVTEEILAEHHLIDVRNDSADPQISTSTNLKPRPVFDEAHVRQMILNVLAEHKLIDLRKDSVNLQMPTPASSNSPTDVLCARCHGPVNASPIILPSFDELSTGIDPMDVSFEPLATSEGPGEAWSQDFHKLYSDGCSNLDVGDDSDRQHRRPPTLTSPRGNRQQYHPGRPVSDRNPSHWS